MDSDSAHNPVWFYSGADGPVTDPPTAPTGVSTSASSSSAGGSSYEEFAAFHLCEHLLIGDKMWRSTEHYFQAMKFEHSPKDFLELAQMESPMEAHKAGRQRSRPLRPDWDSVKDRVMLDCCLAKFSQDPKLEALLDSTGDRPLVERSKKDKYWGDGGDGTGENRRGVILMDVRRMLREKRHSVKNV